MTAPTYKVEATINFPDDDDDAEMNDGLDAEKAGMWVRQLLRRYPAAINFVISIEPEKIDEEEGA